MRQIPIQNMYYILCYAWGMGEMRGKVNVGVERCDSIANLLVHVLLNATDDLLKRGLSQGYTVYGAELDGIKGKINIGETLKLGRYRQGRMYCNYDELSSNILVNQIIYSTLRDALKIRNLSEENESRLRTTIRRMPQMKWIQLSDSVFKSVRLHRNNTYYLFAINICRLLHQSMLPNESLAGKWDFMDLMDDERAMNRIFEKFLMNFYKQECREDYPDFSCRQPIDGERPRAASVRTDADALAGREDNALVVLGEERMRRAILDRELKRASFVRQVCIPRRAARTCRQ